MWDDLKRVGLMTKRSPAGRARGPLAPAGLGLCRGAIRRRGRPGFGIWTGLGRKGFLSPRPPLGGVFGRFSIFATPENGFCGSPEPGKLYFVRFSDGSRAGAIAGNDGGVAWEKWREGIPCKESMGLFPAENQQRKAPRSLKTQFGFLVRNAHMTSVCCLRSKQQGFVEAAGACDRAHVLCVLLLWGECVGCWLRTSGRQSVVLIGIINNDRFHQQNRFQLV